MLFRSIVRYYDHLRFVYDVESTVRELRDETEGNNQNDDNAPQQQSQPGGAGESHRIQKDGDSHPSAPHEDAPQQSGVPAGVPARQPSGDYGDYVEASLRIEKSRERYLTDQGWFQAQLGTLANERRETCAVDPGGSALRVRERKTEWIA